LKRFARPAKYPRTKVKNIGATMLSVREIMFLDG
jgi:hypothetical protein